MPPKAPVQLAIPLPPSFLLPRTLLCVRQRPQSQSQCTKQIRQQRRGFGIKAIDEPRANRFNHNPHEPALLSTPTAALNRLAKSNTLPLRTGALAIKKGMTAVYDITTGTRIPCTVLQLDRVQVLAHKTRKQHGYYAVCVGAGWRHAKNISKPLLGEYSARGVAPKMHVSEFRVADKDGLIPVGTQIPASWFLEGQFVDTRSTSKGKGFQGVMKRWGMHGQDRSHGVSKAHRSMGSAGQGQGGGSRVYPGKKMAGNMGNIRNTVQNLKVLQVDGEKGIVVVNGAVSGPKGCVVMVQDALKKPWPNVSHEEEEPAEINKELREAIGVKVGS